jgi:hypothetical protein
MKRVLLQAILLIGVVTGSVTAAHSWTSVGSAGTVDEADLATFNASGPQMRIDGAAPLPASVVIRYNVVFSEPGSGIALRAVYRDNGAGARVVAVFRQVSMTGATTTLLTLDSDDFSPMAGLQNQQASSSCDLEVQPLLNGYFVEVTLSKSTGAANPALQLVSLVPISC